MAIATIISINLHIIKLICIMFSSKGMIHGIRPWRFIKTLFRDKTVKGVPFGWVLNPRGERTA